MSTCSLRRTLATIVIGTLLVTGGLFLRAIRAEEVVLTTYYPAPFGEIDALKAGR